jgi:hypothetical protein
MITFVESKNLPLDIAPQKLQVLTQTADFFCKTTLVDEIRFLYPIRVEIENAKKTPQRAFLQLQLGDAMLLLGQEKNASTAWQHAYRLAMGSSAAFKTTRQSLKNAYHQGYGHDKAIAALHIARCIEQSENSFVLKSNDTAKEKWLNRAISADPNFFLGWQNLRHFFRRKDKTIYLIKTSRKCALQFPMKACVYKTLAEDLLNNFGGWWSVQYVRESDYERGRKFERLGQKQKAQLLEAPKWQNPESCDLDEILAAAKKYQELSDECGPADILYARSLRAAYFYEQASYVLRHAIQQMPTEKLYIELAKLYSHAKLSHLVPAILSEGTNYRSNKRKAA